MKRARPEVPPPADCLRAKEAARYLGIGEPTLRKMRVHGKGPPYIKTGPKRNARVFYRKQDLEHYKDTEYRVLQSTAEWR